MDRSQINVQHPEGLKGVINTKLNLQDPPPYLSGTTPAPARFTSFVKVVQEEEEEFVWGAMAELEEEVKNIEELVTMWAQEKTEAEKRADKNKEARNRMVSKQGEKTAETHQPAYHWELQIANFEALQQLLQYILDVEVPNIRVHNLLAISRDLWRKVMD